MTQDEFRQRLEEIRRRMEAEIPNFIPAPPDNAPPPPQPFQDAEEDDEP